MNQNPNSIDFNVKDALFVALYNERPRRLITDEILDAEFEKRKGRPDPFYYLMDALDQLVNVGSISDVQENELANHLQNYFALDPTT